MYIDPYSRPGATSTGVHARATSVEMSVTAPIPRATAPRSAPPVAGAREDRRARCRRRVGKTPTPRPSTKLLCLARLASRTRHALAKRFHRAGAERGEFLRFQLVCGFLLDGKLGVRTVDGVHLCSPAVMSACRWHDACGACRTSSAHSTLKDSDRRRLGNRSRALIRQPPLPAASAAAMRGAVRVRSLPRRAAPASGLVRRASANDLSDQIAQHTRRQCIEFDTAPDKPGRV